jgi:hypothetical protein
MSFNNKLLASEIKIANSDKVTENSCQQQADSDYKRVYE